MNRGFAYTNGRLFRGTSVSHVLAMDPADGHQIWDHVLDVQGPGVSIPMAPIAANGLVYVGNAGGDQASVTGHVYALDANDGHVVWKFDVVPETGPARATWTNPKFPISGGAFWTSFTLDEPDGVLYVPAGNPAPDFDAGFSDCEASPSFVREPEGNGVAERFIRTLKENLLWVRTFDTIEELRTALVEFANRYNETWLVARHGYRTPAQVRADQCRLDQNATADLKLAA